MHKQKLIIIFINLSIYLQDIVTLLSIVFAKMSVRFNDDESTGNSERDWEIFDVLCKEVSVTNY